MKISPSGFPGLLLVLFAGVGAYVLFGRQSFLIIMAIGLVAGTITAILIRRQTNKPEQHPHLLTQPDDATEQKQVSLDNEAAEHFAAPDASSGSS